MSSESQKRNRITLALGAMSAVAFSGFYGLIATHAPASSTTAADPQVLTLASANVSEAVATATDAAAVEAAAPAATVAPAAEPTAAPTATPAASTTTTTTHAQTRGS